MILVKSSKDIAKLAGVSQTTVSRVLNNPEKVNQKTYQKVTEVMKKYNYRPNSIARSLVNKKTQSISLLSGPLHNPFFVETTTSIVNYAKKFGFNVNVHFEDMDNNISVYQDVLDQQVDGIILSSILYEDSMYEELKALKIPFIMFNRKHKDSGNFIEIDNIQAGKIATNHLLELNHTDIAWIGGSIETTTFHGRLEGFKLAYEERNLKYEPENIIITNTLKENIVTAIKTVMSRKNRPSAIFAATDSIAIYIIDYLIQQGYNIPNDISVIGIDNVELSQHYSIRLSTVGSVSNHNIGRVAIEYLIKQINGHISREDPVQQTLETQLFPRKTTKEV